MWTLMMTIIQQIMLVKIALPVGNKERLKSCSNASSSNNGHTVPGDVIFTFEFSVYNLF